MREMSESAKYTAQIKDLKTVMMNTALSTEVRKQAREEIKKLEADWIARNSEAYTNSMSDAEAQKVLAEAVGRGKKANQQQVENWRITREKEKNKKIILVVAVILAVVVGTKLLKVW